MGQGTRRPRQARLRSSRRVRECVEMIDPVRSTKFAPTLAAVAIMAIGGAVLSHPVAAQKKLRISDSLPIGHFFAESGTKFWMQRVTDLTKGAVTFEYFPAEQLGKAKDLLTLTRSGV